MMLCWWSVEVVDQVDYLARTSFKESINDSIRERTTAVVLSIGLKKTLNLFYKWLWSIYFVIGWYYTYVTCTIDSFDDPINSAEEALVIAERRPRVWFDLIFDLWRDEERLYQPLPISVFFGVAHYQYSLGPRHSRVSRQRRRPTSYVIILQHVGLGTLYETAN